jgi:excisionase family DNA binding protein
VADGRQITGHPPGTLAVHPVASVAVRVELDPYLSLKGLAGYASLSRRTLQDLVNDSQDPLPSYRVGGKILVRRSDFDRWMIRRRNAKAQALTRLAQADARALLSPRPKK